MKYRTLGRTGLSVSEIGLGCGGKFAYPETPEEDVERVANAALDLGVNFLDTGSNYGLGVSETRIGRLLKGRRGDFLLATKCGSRLMLEPGKAPWVKRDFTYDGLIASVEDSLKRLQTDHVDLLQFHTATAAALEKNGEGLVALQEMKKRGYARFLGASCDGDIALQAIETGVLDAIQISFNVATQEPLEKILPAARKANIGVIVKEPLANVFFMRVPKPGADFAWQHACWERAQHFRFLQECVSPKPVQTALKFVLGSPGVSTAIVATVDRRHLDENVEVPNLPNLESAMVDRIRVAYSQTGREHAQGRT